MAEEDAQVKIIPDDPEYQEEEHITYKRKQEALNARLKQLFQSNISEFRLIMDGSVYAYTKMVLKNKGIRQITPLINQYAHLSFNLLEQIGNVQRLKFLTFLNASRNRLTDVRFLSDINCFPYLKTISLANNKVKSLPNVALKNILHLNLNFNQINAVDEFDGHPKLQILELRGNKLQNLKGLQRAASLRQLYLAQNCLTALNGLNNLPQLGKLHLRKNKISQVSQFPSLPKLKYLNLRQNAISKVANIAAISPTVVFLNLLANPISQELGDNVKKQVWMKFRNYTKINKSQVTPEEKEEFDKQFKERQAQKARQEKERLERQAAQAAQAAEKAKQQQE